MKNNFVEYALFYDVFNESKDYVGESLYINSLIKRFKPDAIDILDIGCGTGLHAIEFAKQRYDVTGIDISKEMIDIAKEKNKETNLDLNFFLDSKQVFNSIKKFDVAVSLFHVTSYQTSESSFIKFFNLASRNLRTGGIFIFDYWFTPAVHFLRLEERVKSTIIDGKSIHKRSKPTMLSTDLFNIDITISAENFEMTESHLMKSFIPDDFNQIRNFKSIKSLAWLTNENPNLKNWTAISILQKM